MFSSPLVIQGEAATSRPIPETHTEASIIFTFTAFTFFFTTFTFVFTTFSYSLISLCFSPLSSHISLFALVISPFLPSPFVNPFYLLYFCLNHHLHLITFTHFGMLGVHIL